MRKIILSISFALISLRAAAQSLSTPGVFNHISVAASAGTTGLGFEVAVPLTAYLNIRTGYEKIPSIKMTTKIPYSLKGQSSKVKVEEKFSLDGWKILFDVYPSKYYIFHLTIGLYSGESVIVTAMNVTPLDDLLKSLPIGGFNIAVNDGHVSATMEVNKVKPYLGIGFGRAVPKRRMGVVIDLGVLFWGTPTVYENVTGRHLPVGYSDLDKIDKDGIMNTISKIKAWPVLSVRLTGRLF